MGAEYTFDFQNINIERGLLWNQENEHRADRARWNRGQVLVHSVDGFSELENALREQAAKATAMSPQTAAQRR
jgi:hypothetical protein